MPKLCSWGMVFHDSNLGLIPRLVDLYVTAHVKWILT